MFKALPKVLTVVGARPQFVKAAIVSTHLRRMQSAPYEEVLVHTGQHYDRLLSDIFFYDLRMESPVHQLHVGSNTAVLQIAAMLERLESVLDMEKPDAVLVYGDTNSTLAAAICASQHNLPLVHVEAGERIFRRNRVPEEVNRILSDHAAWLCLASTRRGLEHLRREGMGPQRARFVGDPMFDIFRWATESGRHRLDTRASLGLHPTSYHVATIHRAENTASPKPLFSLLEVLDSASKPVLLPVHPRVANILRNEGWQPKGNLRLMEPLGYFEFLNLLIDCDKCITDSGGVTREAFFARKPCLIPMENSWWVDIVEAGWALETGADHQKLKSALEEFVAPEGAPENLFGDGNSAAKIVAEVSAVVAAPKHEGAWHKHGSFFDLPKSQPRAGKFTYDDYSAMVRCFLSADYSFATFLEAQALLQKGNPFVVLRHDIDVSLEKALELAEVEASLGVVATYFFMVRTDHYNIFSEQGTKIISSILKHGHALGLHFDCAAYTDVNVDVLAAACGREAAMMENWFGKPVAIVSFHRPDERVLSGNPSLSVPRYHTYMDFYTKQMSYFSDSTGRWRYGEPHRSVPFADRRPIHILTHPFWWNVSSKSAYDTLLKLVDHKQEMLEHSLAQNCTVYRVGHLKEEFLP